MVAFTVSLIWPVLHAWQVLPADGWYLPISQSLHSAAFTSANWPLSHAAQLCALYSLLNSPTAHSAHGQIVPASSQLR